MRAALNLTRFIRSYVVWARRPAPEEQLAGHPYQPKPVHCTDIVPQSEKPGYSWNPDETSDGHTGYNNPAESSQKLTFDMDFTSSSRSLPLTSCGKQGLLSFDVNLQARTAETWRKGNADFDNIDPPSY
jgi:hypothetical protein